MKSYTNWTPVKSVIDATTKRPTYKEGDVFWLAVGENIGFEQDGKGRMFARPVLIVSGFSKEVFWGLSLTSQNKQGRYYRSFTLNNGIASTAILSQLRAYDSKRIVNTKKLGRVSQATLLDIKNRLKALL